jgi:hypothetical protein
VALTTVTSLEARQVSTDTSVIHFFDKGLDRVGVFLCLYLTNTKVIHEFARNGLEVVTQLSGHASMVRVAKRIDVPDKV